jgi:hypothetical protein
VITIAFIIGWLSGVLGGATTVLIILRHRLAREVQRMDERWERRRAAVIGRN